MLRFVVLLTICGFVASAPQRPRQADNDVTILRSNNEHNEDGSFNWDFETSDGTKVEQSGRLINVGTEQEGISIQGQYSYIEPEGETILLKYIADEKGFVPEGAHLPVAPPIPEEIQRALEIIYKNAKDQVGKERH